MDWKSFIVSMTGPVQAGIRYVVVVLLGNYAIQHGFGDETLWTSVASTIGALVVAGIGLATSTKSAVVAKADAVTK